jgi:hypothetical protein
MVKKALFMLLCAVPMVASAELVDRAVNTSSGIRDAGAHFERAAFVQAYDTAPAPEHSGKSNADLVLDLAGDLLGDTAKPRDPGFLIEPWVPGHHAVGIKVEVTW